MHESAIATQAQLDQLAARHTEEEGGIQGQVISSETENRSHISEVSTEAMTKYSYFAVTGSDDKGWHADGPYTYDDATNLVRSYGARNVKAALVSADQLHHFAGPFPTARS